ncbi:TetR/AcrR family transcriptional regulator [Flammeovirga aprica]|uniref:TetR/AcrR family transcriptional regulator n=1 Tax=Flammeovirga aprica JL-4 TaxID=694437 RepID=A0A7X9RSS9_9BACT|nr:TetR/AcrR family transcriptional regulator [Flammeovirga aprica]NME66347.1 TetR/AcrR family transcriptional regulator [Flammeovirga aprica JL-4]
MVNDQLRLRIIEEARKQFQGFGLKRVTMSDIAERLGMSKKTLYNVFRNKKELIEFTLTYYMEEDSKFIEDVAKLDQDGVFKLAKVFYFFYERMRAINPSVFMDLKKFYPEVWDKYECHKEGCFHETLISIIKQGSSEGHFYNDIDVEMLVLMRMWQVEVAFDASVFPHDRFPMAKVQVELFKHFIRGIATPNGVKLLDQYLKQFINQESQSTNL